MNSCPGEDVTFTGQIVVGLEERRMSGGEGMEKSACIREYIYPRW